jgi:hypothetical protein
VPLNLSDIAREDGVFPEAPLLCGVSPLSLRAGPSGG